MSVSIPENVRSIASDLFGIPAERIFDHSSPETIEAWDSVQQLNFVLALEEKFNIQLSPEEMEQMHNIGEVVRLVENRLQNATT